ncbi:MAG: LCCL domain-containing protein [bacterium]
MKYILWTTTASARRGQNGRRLTFGCRPQGQLATIWGTTTYTDDSSICTAAVHAGQITVASGGVVTIEIRPGLASYPGGAAHGVPSGSWGQWSGSFVFIGSAKPLPAQPPVAPGGPMRIQWSTNAQAYRTRLSKRFTLSCPAGGQLGSVWGTGIYTDDSSVCSAAVHAGIITKARGGTVSIEMQPAQGSYLGSARFGVTSRSWNAWQGSFIFVRGTQSSP